MVGGLTAYSASPFVVTFSGGGIIDACSFAAKVDFNTGLNPLGIAVSDFDGDGKPDVAITNRTSQTLAVYRNISTAGSIGTSSLAGPVNFPTQADPFSAMVGDMDGDGKPDLIVPNAISSTVSVFRNTSSSGTISFATRVDFAAGNNPLRSAIRDLDGDGKPELAVCNRFSNSISVYKNISIPGAFTSTSFAAPVNFITGSEPYSVAVADLDGDGKPEMVAVNNLSNSVSVYKNTSTTGIIDASSFAPKVDFITGNRPNGIAIGDLDGDSKVDIVVTNNFAGSTISILQNISSGSITAGSFAAKVDFTSGSDPFEAMIGDLDGDGKPDLAVTNGASNTVSIFKNTSSVGSISSGSFANKVDFVTGTAPYGFQIGDLDGDGRPEVLAGNHNSNTLSILRNTVSSLVPNISNFTPTSGLIGATVTITGSNFSTTPSENIVMFNGVTATITASTATTLTATVPIGATTGPIDITIGCNAITSTTNFTVIICPAAPSPIPNQGCQNTAVTLGALGGVNGQYRWYSVATGGTAIAGEVNSSYTTPSISATTTYFVSINNGTCESSRTTVTATINSLPATPTAIGASSCGPASPVTLIASGGTNGQYRWYTSSTGGTAIAGETNSSYTTPSISATTTYFVSINNGTCESSRTTVTATINSLPTAPTVTGASSCGPASPVTLIATGGTNGQYRWYTTATGGVAITGEVNSSYTTPSISATTTY